MYPCCALGQETGVDLTLQYGNLPSCPGLPEMYAEVSELMQVISDPDRYRLAAMADFGGEPDRSFRVNAVLQSKGFDELAYAFAWHLLGGDDCEVTSSQGKDLVNEYKTIQARYSAMMGPGPEPYIPPPSTPGIYRPPSQPYTAGVGGTSLPWWIWPVLGVAVVAATTGGRKR